jgi:uncharacterized protein YndB with AHSA1/START domain
MPLGSISHRVEVPTTAAAAFDAFAGHIGSWWPLAYTFSQNDFADAAIDGRVGGSWYERNSRGEVLSWGDVRVYEPGSRLVLGFAISPDRKPADIQQASEVEVRFIDEGVKRSIVEIEHRHFERHGDGAEAMRTGMDSVRGWPLLLAELRRWIDRRH